MAHTHIPPSTQDSEAGKSLQIQSQPGLHSESQSSLGYTEWDLTQNHVVRFGPKGANCDQDVFCAFSVSSLLRGTERVGAYL